MTSFRPKRSAAHGERTLARRSRRSRTEAGRKTGALAQGKGRTKYSIQATFVHVETISLINAFDWRWQISC